MRLLKTSNSARRRAAETHRANRAYAYRESLVRKRESGLERTASATDANISVVQVEPSDQRKRRNTGRIPESGEYGVRTQKKRRASVVENEKIYLQESAERLRREATAAEEYMQHHLRSSDGWIFQHPIRFTGKDEGIGAILDFYHPKRKIAVELDGSVHQSPEQKRRDAERTKVLALRHGITVLRFRNDEACFDTKRVLADIAAAGTLPKPPRVSAGRKQRAVSEPFVPVVKTAPVESKRHEPVVEDGLCRHELLLGTCSFCR